ncbi:beta-lactamase-like protein [Aspergillus californicus]
MECLGNSLVKYAVPDNESILSLLCAHEINPGDLQMIVLSHLHNDHTGGLTELHEAAPHVPIYVSPDQWDVFGKHPLYATFEGCVPSQWPRNFSPTILEPTDQVLGPWTHCYPLASDGKVVAVDTPGHVPGHISLVVYEDSIRDGSRITYFLTGDAVYGIDVLDKGQPDGINSDPKTALRSLELIKEFATQTDVVVLPSHDVNTPQILADRSVYKPKQIGG